MAKKKATMTLKDFHGGSIPSDLPLPSAPGVTVRPLNHTGFDRPTSWSNPMGRQDQRLRPGSAGAIRTYDDKPPFLTQNAQIGRNFDEDERKPLDGGSTPRRTVSDENIPTRPATVPTPLSHFSPGNNNNNNNNSNSNSNTGGSYKQVKNFDEDGRILHSNNNTGGSYAARFSESVNITTSKISGPGPSPNAWGPRKVAYGPPEPVAASWSVPDAATKLAHASALEKVSSGRWLSNQSKQIDVEVIRHPEPEGKVQFKGNVYGSVHSDGGQVQVQVQTVYSGGTVGGAEVNERPKLKLLPRSKPVDIIEPLVAYKQTVPQSGEPLIANDFYGNVKSSEDIYQPSEQQRVNLKPRSQPIEQVERNTERERNALFGGARPRELVLKERGVDDVAVNHDIIQSPNRVKKDITRSDNSPIHQPVTSRQNSKPEPFDHHRTQKPIDRREPEKPDSQRRTNWRTDNRKSSRDLDPQPERPPSPDTWRKPEEPAPPAGTRHGKAASAVELAQAFSKSVSDPKVVTSSRGFPGPAQIPFSRLTGQPVTRSQINGH